MLYQLLHLNRWAVEHACMSMGWDANTSRAHKRCTVRMKEDVTPEHAPAMTKTKKTGAGSDAGDTVNIYARIGARSTSRDFGGDLGSGAWK